MGMGQDNVPAPTPSVAAADAARLTADDRARIDSAHEAATAENTRRTYAAQWKAFAAWCAGRGFCPLPAAPDVAGAWLTVRAETRKTATVRIGRSAIRAAHRAAGLPDPTGDPSVARACEGVARQHAANPDAAPRQARPLTYDEAVTLLAVAANPAPYGRGVEGAATTARRARLDACIVALLFCAGMRRSEVAALRWADVAGADGGGNVRVRVRCSKTNQRAERPDYRLLVNGFARSLEAARAAAAEDGGAPDPAAHVVPLSPRQIARRLASLGERAGVPGLSGHSGRVGLAVELVRRGASTTSVQDAGGWRSPAMVARYAAQVRAEDGAVARYFGKVESVG